MKKFNLRNLAAIVIYTVLVAVLFVSCNEKSEQKANRSYKLVVTAHNGNGWNRSWHSIKCDSVNMITIKKAEIFIDGTKMIIEADDRITVHSN